MSLLLTVRERTDDMINFFHRANEERDNARITTCP